VNARCSPGRILSHHTEDQSPDLFADTRRRGCCVCSASNCRRRAKFSRTRSARQLKELTNQPKKCRSDTIMARILAEKSESSLSPSHSFCRCTTFWRGTPRTGATSQASIGVELTNVDSRNTDSSRTFSQLLNSGEHVSD